MFVRANRHREAEEKGSERRPANQIEITFQKINFMLM